MADEFDPNRPFEQMDVGAGPAPGGSTSQEFDPNKPFDSEKDINSKKNIGGAKAAGEHFLQGATLGYWPQIQAGIEKPIIQGMDLLTGGKVAESLPDYASRRDEYIHRLEEQEKEHPVASTVGTVGGALGSAIPLGGALAKLPGLAGLGALQAGEGASLAARMGALGGRTAGAAGAAGVQGALMNPGDTENEVSPLQLGERAKQALGTAAIGAPLHLAGEGVSSVGKYIAGRLKNKAEETAFRALGPYKRQVNQNRDEIKDIGREAMDSGVIGWKPGSAETLEQRASGAAEATGKQLGNLTDELASLEKGATSSGVSRKEIADNLREKLLVDNPQGIPGIDKRNSRFEKMIKEFQDSGEKPSMPGIGDLDQPAIEGAVREPRMSFADLRQAKMNVQGTKDQPGLINWNRLKGADVPIEEQFHRELASQLREGEEAGADAIEKAFFGQSSNRVKELKEKYGSLSAAARIASNRADAQKANQILGLRDAITGSAGASLGGYLGYKAGGHEGAKTGALLGGGIGGLGSKLSREYGPQISAKTADALSSLFAKVPGLAENVTKNPTLLPGLIDAFEGPKLSPEGTPEGSPEEVKRIIAERRKKRGIANQ